MAWNINKIALIRAVIWGGMVMLDLKTAAATSATLTLKDALTRALSSNPELSAFRYHAEAEDSATRAQAWPNNPQVGLAYEKDSSLMQQQMGPMTSASISQEILFPPKYILRGSAQHHRAQAADQEYANKKLEIRQKVMSAYYNLYAIRRTIDLLKAQKETLREIARIAESKRATGVVPQQDEMKAHVEQTKLESELLLAIQESEITESALNVLLYQNPTQPILLTHTNLDVPKITVALDTLTEQVPNTSPTIKQQEYLSEEAKTQKSLADLGYAPDFMLTFQKPFINAPAGAYQASVGISIPLWFFMQQTSEVASATRRSMQSENLLIHTRQEVHSMVRVLSAKIRTNEKILKIYETALIPQASSTLNSSRSAYKAGRTSFIELLDSERSVYALQIAYYQALTQYVTMLSELERVTGQSISSLPFGDG